MAQYQSFPDAAGDSRTLDKLKALRLPVLKGRAFLDIGCNEGYFCGFARFAGAARAVGIDHSAEFIRRAKARFPDCEFHARNWEHLPEGQFDVILLASALHYADDQPALIARLVDKLTDNGVLILELGIVSSPRAEWVKVKRGIDERYFATMPQLKETLADYAWKWMGASVNQAGDPVARHVVHVSRRRPVAYLLMQPPAFGKSSVAKRLFPSAQVPILSGDQVIQDIATNALAVSTRLRDLVANDYSPFAVDKVVQRVFDKKLGAELVQAWVAEAGRRDFAFDGFVPTKYQGEVEKQLAEAGYMPITLRWERVAPALLPLDSLDKQARAFDRTLAENGAPQITASDRPGQQPVAGYVDELRVEQGCVTVRGWAIDENGDLPAQLVFGLGSERTFVDVGAARQRKDVQRSLELPHASVGYLIEIATPDVTSIADMGRQGFSLTLPSGRPLRMAQSVAAALAGVATP